ncbi:unnamed protein product [Aspergillus niger]|uniref:Contig An02c0270, genomic contig n=1 Tax=Aspergillus niger (strain ATCC MYA-4892 / CBS 513.88 / FGSC A1513) TaxID=425011 RepID=A2QDW7_ASPNC|nr:unnamed protein product [Aspergillus niger]
MAFNSQPWKSVQSLTVVIDWSTF